MTQTDFISNYLVVTTVIALIAGIYLDHAASGTVISPNCSGGAHGGCYWNARACACACHARAGASQFANTAELFCFILMLASPMVWLWLGFAKLGSMPLPPTHSRH